MTLRSKIELFGRELGVRETPMDENEFDAGVEDDVLQLMFIARHPVLPVESRVAPTLKMVAGRSTEEIARGFLLRKATMAARITRAKMTLTAADESETHALVALMEIQASRLCARTGPKGESVTLDKQDRARWTGSLIAGTGSFGMQAKIAACHARAPRAEDTDWVRIASLYGDLVA